MSSLSASTHAKYTKSRDEGGYLSSFDILALFIQQAQRSAEIDDDSDDSDRGDAVRETDEIPRHVVVGSYNSSQLKFLSFFSKMLDIYND